MDTPRLGELTRELNQRELRLDYAAWLALLVENRMPHQASRAFLERFPKSNGAAIVRKSVEAWDLKTKAAVAPGTATDPAWAAPLVAISPLKDAFFAIARSKSLLGRIAGLRRVPFATKIPIETTGANYQWVTENAPKPVSAMAFSNSLTLAALKAQAIVVVSEELVKLAVDGFQSALADTLTDGLTAFTDKSFLDPASTAIANTRPASVTAGTTPITATASYATDVQTLLTAFFTARPGAEGAVLIANAGHASQLRTLNAGGGPGLPVLVSEAALGHTIALDPAGVFVADDGIDISISREASVQMNDAPDAPATATTVQVSLWQQNLRGFRVERFVNWAATTGAVKYLAG
jgi:Phage capsid family